MGSIKNIFTKLKGSKVLLYLFLVILYSVIFIFVFGYTNFDVHYTDWCLSNYNHADTHDINLNYMRFFAFLNDSAPVPYYQNMMFPFRGTLLNIDYVPILALIIKIFYKYILHLKNIINIQYVWWFGLFCIIAQGIISFEIIKKLANTKNINAILCSIFFVIAPPLIMRFPYNFTMCAHFLILLSFLPFVYKYTKKQLMIFCFLLGFLSCGIFVYFIPLTFISIFAYGVYKIIKKESVSILFTACLLHLSGVVAAILIFNGLKISDLSPYGIGYGGFSANLNTFFNPVNIFNIFKSNLFPFLNKLRLYSSDQNEGFAYLGGGIFVLFAISLYLLFKYKFTELKSFVLRSKSEIYVFISIFVVAMFLAITPVITISGKIIYEITYIPEIIYKILSLFRATGRFIWINFYLIYFILFIFLIKNINGKKLTTVLFIGLILQIYDLHSAFLILNKEYSSKRTYVNSLSDDKTWQELIQRKDSIVVFEYYPFDYVDFLDFAIKNNFKMNNLQWGREIMPDKYYGYLNFVYNNTQNNILYVFEKNNISDIKNYTNLKYCYLLNNGKIVCVKTQNKKLKSIDI